MHQKVLNIYFPPGKLQGQIFSVPDPSKTIYLYPLVVELVPILENRIYYKFKTNMLHNMSQRNF
jgi:hypothetical protein